MVCVLRKPASDHFLDSWPISCEMLSGNGLLLTSDARKQMKSFAYGAENVLNVDPASAYFARGMFENTLQREIEARRGNRCSATARFSRGFVMEQAAERYFQALDVAKRRLKGRFDEEDFGYMLNLNCSPVWHHYAQDNLAGLIADSLGLEVTSLDDIPDAKLRDLMKKLRELTPVETYAIVDTCEQVWRGYDNTLI